MAGTRDGAMKRAAARQGLTVEAYAQRVAGGEKWCTGCKAWHPAAVFVVDRSRWDGRATKCRDHTRRQPRQFALRFPRRRWLAPTRDGDKRQARSRVNFLVTAGRLPDPNTVACTDCGHAWRKGERRHEYDHYLGYGAAHQLDVQAVCTTCHARRSEQRGESKHARGARGRFEERAG
jgi:hypothetical protein